MGLRDEPEDDICECGAGTPLYWRHPGAACARHAEGMQRESHVRVRESAGTQTRFHLQCVREDTSRFLRHAEHARHDAGMTLVVSTVARSDVPTSA